MQSALSSWCFPIVWAKLVHRYPVLRASGHLEQQRCSLFSSCSCFTIYLNFRNISVLKVSGLHPLLCPALPSEWSYLISPCLSIAESLLTMRFLRNKIPKDLNQLRLSYLLNRSATSAPELYHPPLLLLHPFKRTSRGEVALCCVLSWQLQARRKHRDWEHRCRSCPWTPGQPSRVSWPRDHISLHILIA